MNTTNHNADEKLKLEDLTPPIYQNRKLRWSGEGDAPGTPGRIPELGETVLWGKKAFAVVDGYFQTKGTLGVKLILDISGERVCSFGSEIVVAPDTSTTWMDAFKAPYPHKSNSQDNVMAQRAEVKRVLKWVN